MELRHHGWPSPLLDWTKCYLIALYFAVTEQKSDSDAALFCLAENHQGPTVTETTAPFIQFHGPYDREGRPIGENDRPHLQRAVYSTCTQNIAPNEPQENDFNPNAIRIREHSLFLDEEARQSLSMTSVLWKIIIPFKIRDEILTLLNEHGITKEKLGLDSPAQEGDE